MYPEADALLDAVFDHPDDDTPRMVYADWLQEHGQENHAQFIRLQCAAARCRVWSDEGNDLWVRIGRVWNRLSEEWWPATVEPWPDIESRWNQYLLDATHFDRGFLRGTIPVSLAQIVRYANCWCWLPSPGNPLLLCPSDDFGGLEPGRLRRIRTVRCEVTWEEVQDTGEEFRPLSTPCESLLRSPHLCNIRELDLSNVALTRSTVRVMLTAPHLARVEDLYVAFDGSRDCDPEEAVLQLKSRFKRVIRC